MKSANENSIQNVRIWSETVELLQKRDRKYSGDIAEGATSKEYTCKKRICSISEIEQTAAQRVISRCEFFYSEIIEFQLNATNSKSFSSNHTRPFLETLRLLNYKHSGPTSREILRKWGRLDGGFKYLEHRYHHKEPKRFFRNQNYSAIENGKLENKIEQKGRPFGIRYKNQVRMEVSHASEVTGTEFVQYMYNEKYKSDVSIDLGNKMLSDQVIMNKISENEQKRRKPPKAPANRYKIELQIVLHQPRGSEHFEQTDQEKHTSFKSEFSIERSLCYRLRVGKILQQNHKIK